MQQIYFIDPFIALLFIFIFYFYIARSIFNNLPINVFGKISCNVSSNGRYSNLDSMRGLFSFFVFFGHFVTLIDMLGLNKNYIYENYFVKIRNVGSIGVAFFFVITGFLYWTIFLKRTPHIDPYITQRIRRLAPVLLFSYFCTLILISMSNPILNFSSFKKIESFFSIFSIGGYQLDYNEYVALLVGPTWSLKYEIIYYLCLPSIAVLRTKLSPIFLHILLFVLQYYWCSDPHVKQYWLPNNSFFYIWGGMLVAELNLKMDILLKGYKLLIEKVFIIIGNACFVYVIIQSENFTYNYIHIIPFAIVIISLIRGNCFFGFLNDIYLNKLGIISYSTYLMHGVVLSCVGLIYKHYDLGNGISQILQLSIIFLISVVAVTILSIYSYFNFERPYLFTKAGSLSN